MDGLSTLEASNLSSLYSQPFLVYSGVGNQKYEKNVLQNTLFEIIFRVIKQHDCNYIGSVRAYVVVNLKKLEVFRVPEAAKHIIDPGIQRNPSTPTLRIC